MDLPEEIEPPYAVKIIQSTSVFEMTFDSHKLQKKWHEVLTNVMTGWDAQAKDVSAQLQYYGDSKGKIMIQHLLPVAAQLQTQSPDQLN